MAGSSIKDSNLYYDTHAKNVIVDCKEGKDLESLIENGEIGGGSGSSIGIDGIYLSTSSLDVINNTMGGKWDPLGVIQLKINGGLTEIYAYIKIE